MDDRALLIDLHRQYEYFQWLIPDFESLVIAYVQRVYHYFFQTLWHFLDWRKKLKNRKWSFCFVTLSFFFFAKFFDLTNFFHFCFMLLFFFTFRIIFYFYYWRENWIENQIKSTDQFLVQLINKVQRFLPLLDWYINFSMVL